MQSFRYTVVTFKRRLDMVVMIFAGGRGQTAEDEEGKEDGSSKLFHRRDQGE